jgi:uncharacterized membrane protein YdjX (TVP38/TMEM64 family)
MKVQISSVLVVLVAEALTSSAFVYRLASPRCIDGIRRREMRSEGLCRTGGRRAVFGVRPSRNLHVLSVKRNADNTCQIETSIHARNGTSSYSLNIPHIFPRGEAQQPVKSNSAINSLVDFSLRGSDASLRNDDSRKVSTSLLQTEGSRPAAAAVAALLSLGVAAVWWFQSHGTISGEHSIDFESLISWVQGLLSHPQESLQSVVDSVHDMGPMGLVYFGLIYLVAEILAVPATPLTLSAGCLFGVTRGTAVVLVSATLAATFAFWIGKTVLRSWVEEKLQENPKFAKLDRAIGEQGFQLLLLVRLSPIFPFALSNYLYGASSISFAPYFFGTLLGFTPGTLAYVYTGMVGKALTLGGGDGGTQPWYIYAGGLAVLTGLLSLVSQVASNIIESMDDEGDDSTSRSMPL